MAKPPRAALILVRHAHRDLTDRTMDNGLSAKGRQQVEELMKHIKKLGFDKNDMRIYSSERARCVETVEPLAEWAEREVRISPLLMEQEGEEKDGEFLDRIDEFMKRAQKKVIDKQRVVVACTHGDWLPLALRKSLGEHVDFVKGACAVLLPSEGSAEGASWVLSSFFRPKT